MSCKHYPQPQYAPLQRVLVIEEQPPGPAEGGVLGGHGVVLWRTGCFVDNNRFGMSGWLYVIQFSGENAYGLVEESRVLPTGEDVSLASFLGRDFEISYDDDGVGPDAIAGTFRLPGGFWNAFTFCRAAVEEVQYEIRIPVRFYLGGIAKYKFLVPEAIILDCEYIENVMSSVFGTNAWIPVGGPQSAWCD